MGGLELEFAFKFLAPAAVPNMFGGALLLYAIWVSQNNVDVVPCDKLLLFF